MAYIKNEWKIDTFQRGDEKLITNLNHMEDGIAEGGGGGTSYTAGEGIDITNNTISVTEVVRNGAALGATAIQTHQDISGKANVGDSYTKAESDAKYLTSHQDISGKQDKLIAGTNINIAEDGKTISAESVQLSLDGTSGTLTTEQRTLLENKSVNILRDNMIYKLSAVTSTSSGPLRTYDLIIDNNVAPMYHFIIVNMLSGGWGSYSTSLQDKLTAGTNISIDEVTHTISATDTKYTAGTNITIDSNNVISAASGTTVVANPTLTGTEAELSGLQVGDTKYAIPTSRNFPSTWPISDTCLNFLKAVAQDSSAVVGRTYQGGVEFSDLYDDLGLYNAEAEVEIISSTLSTGHKVIRLNIYSATNEPYSWARIYWWTGSSGTIRPWQITARAANQYTEPYYTGTCNKTTGVISLGTTISKGVYLVNIYGTQSTTQISYTYYFAYGGYQDWMTYSTDSCGTTVSALSGTLTMSRVDGQALNWDSDATVEIYKMR